LFIPIYRDKIFPWSQKTLTLASICDGGGTRDEENQKIWATDAVIGSTISFVSIQLSEEETRATWMPDYSDWSMIAISKQNPSNLLGIYCPTFH
jgi:hypothetical protein